MNSWVKLILGGVTTVMAAAIIGFFATGFFVVAQTNDNTLKLAQLEIEQNEHETLDAHPEQGKATVGITLGLKNLNRRLDAQDRAINGLRDELGGKIDQLRDHLLYGRSRSIIVPDPPDPPKTPREYLR